MAKITQAECEAKGWNWNEKRKTCTMPDIRSLKAGIGRGDGCDGGTRIVTIRRRLPLAVRLAIISAAKAELRGKKKRPA